jgi:hypothetical protein
MNNHRITIERVSSNSGSPPTHDYQAQCLCGWISNRSWLEATARRVANSHLATGLPEGHDNR